MAIVFPIDIPFEQISTTQWVTETATSISISEFTFAGQKQVFPGTRWRAEVGFPTLNVEDAGALTGFIAALNGKEGSFLLGNPSKPTPAGAASEVASSPVVDGAGQTGNQLLIRNAPASIANWFVLGDLFQLGPSSRARLHMITQNASTSPTGTATLCIWPNIKRATLDGDPVNYTAPRGLFALDTNRPGWDVSAPFRYGVRFPAIEAI